MKHFIIVLFFVLCSCTPYYPAEQKQFYDKLKNLYSGYRDYKIENLDFDVARAFSKKVRVIESGKVLPPETISPNPHFFLRYRSYPKDEMVEYRSRMFYVMENDLTRTEYYEDGANLQFYFDCWVKEEENYTKFGQIARCRQSFLDTLIYLEFKLSNITEEMLREIKEDRVVSIPPIKPTKFTIYFDFDSSKINERGEKDIWEIIKYADTLRTYTIKIYGHADRTGKVLYNEKLSKRRSETVKHYLIKNHIPEQRIILEKWEGEMEPRVLTEDNFKEYTNRRTVVIVEKVEE